MADKRISQLPPAGVVTEDDLFHISQAGIDKSASGTAVTSYLLGELDESITEAEGLVNEANLASAAAIAARNAAQTSATNAATSASNAATSRTQAQTAATNAATSETNAQKWASNPVDTIVSGSLYSAMHYATKASASASTATTQASTATTQAGIATTKASEASTSASGASGSATAAGNAKTASEAARDAAVTAKNTAVGAKDDAEIAATAALASQNSATASASSASSNATNAATARTNAELARDASVAAKNTSVSARDAAVIAKNAAESSATSAGNAATTALSARDTAVSSKDTAVASATTATTKAGEAATSASNASASASTASTAAGNATLAKNASEAARDTAQSAASTATTQAGNASSSFTSFDKRYLGAKSTFPTVDNQGAALADGALFYMNAGGSKGMYLYNGSTSSWNIAYVDGTGFVNGPSSVTNNTVALFDGTSGKLLKQGPLITTSQIDSTTGRLLKVGDFGIGSLTSTSISGEDILAGTQGAGFYSTSGSGSIPVNGMVISIGGYNGRRSYLRVTEQGALHVRGASNGPAETGYLPPNWATEYQVYTTGNSTVDSNGFLKNGTSVAAGKQGVTDDDVRLTNATTSKTGISRFATTTEHQDGVLSTVSATPAGVKSYVDQFGIRSSAADVSNLLTQDLSKLKFFRLQSGAVGGVGYNATCISMPYDGSPLWNLLAWSESRVWVTRRGEAPVSSIDWVELLSTNSGTTVGRAVFSAADAAAARTAIDASASNDVRFTTIPQNTKSANYTCVLGDAGKHIFHPSADTTARTFTIPANASVAYPIGTTLSFVNQHGGGVITIAITTDTMRLVGDGKTGSRTLAANGIATAIKVAATQWQITGVNLT